MKSLAKGNNEEAILKLLKNLIATTQGVKLKSLNYLIELLRDLPR